MRRVFQAARQYGPSAEVIQSPEHDHFYTKSATEHASSISQSGYVDEGIACHVLHIKTKGALALLRAFNPSSGDHFYTTSQPELANAVAQLGYVAEDSGCFVLPKKGSVIVPFLRAYNAKTGDHFYTTSVAEMSNAVAKGGYSNEGDVGSVHDAPAAGTQPFLRAYNPINGDHFYTRSATEHANAVTKLGYQDEGIACHVFAEAGTGRKPLFRLLKKFGGGIRIHLKIVQDYVIEETAAFVFPPNDASAVPLLRAFNPATGDHFYTTSKTEHQNAVLNGYNDEGTACTVPSPTTPGTVALLRAYNPGNGDHFYTTSKAEHDHAVQALGYNDESVACQVFSSAQPKTVPLFRLYDAASGDHFYTVSTNERDTAAGNAGPSPLIIKTGKRGNIATCISSMRDAYNQAAIHVEIGSTEFISVPDAVDVDVGNCNTFFGSTGNQDDLFSHADFVPAPTHVAGNTFLPAPDITIYFVRTTVAAEQRLRYSPRLAAWCRCGAAM